MKTYDYNITENFLKTATLTDAVSLSSFRLNKGLYNWLKSHFQLNTDCYAAAIFFQAGYVAGIRAERARRKKNVLLQNDN